MQAPENEPVSGLFDLCGKIREHLNETHVIADKLAGAVPDDEIAEKEVDTYYLNDLERKLRAILRDTNNLVGRLQEIERRF